MQLVLANCKPSPLERVCNTFSLTVAEDHILQQLEEQGNLDQNQTRNDGEDITRKELISQLSSEIGSLEVRCFPSPETDDDASLKMIALLFSRERSILGKLAQKFEENVTISLSLHFTRNRNSAPESTPLVATPKNDASCTIQGMKIDRKSNGMISVGASTFNPEDAVIAIDEMTINRLEILANIPTRRFLEIIVSSAAERILETRAGSDLIILAGNGTEIKANKCFLLVCGPDLKAMVESQTGRIDMSNLSEEGVEAFLRYIYIKDLKQPKENMQIACELLYAGHKYNVPDLEAEMKTLLLNKKNEDIGKEWAFKIYMLNRNIDGAVEVKTKAVQVLSMQDDDDDHPYAMSGLEYVIETFLEKETKNRDMDLALAFKMYMFIRTIETAADLKTKTLQIMKAKLDELEFLEEYNELFEKPSRFKTAKALCLDLAKTSSSSG